MKLRGSSVCSLAIGLMVLRSLVSVTWLITSFVSGGAFGGAAAARAVAVVVVFATLLFELVLELLQAARPGNASSEPDRAARLRSRLREKGAMPSPPVETLSQQ